ncbi:MAG: hypothetical protein V3S33_08580 [Gammaproteobacteria bacterium]
MSFVRDFLYLHGVDLVGKLVLSGFSNGQAQLFLMETPGHVLSVLSQRDSEEAPAKNSDAGAVATVIAGLDVAGLAAKAEIEPSLANKGLKTLIPTLLAYFRDMQGGSRQSDIRFPTIH